MIVYTLYLTPVTTRSMPATLLPRPIVVRLYPSRSCANCEAPTTPCSSWANRLRSKVDRLYGSASDGDTSVEDRRGTTPNRDFVRCRLLSVFTPSGCVGRCRRRRAACCPGELRAFLRGYSSVFTRRWGIGHERNEESEPARKHDRHVLLHSQPPTI